MTSPATSVNPPPPMANVRPKERAGARSAGGAHKPQPLVSRLRASGAESWVALAVVGIVVLLVLPLPPVLLDAALALSIAVSVLILLVTLSTSDPLDFSIFPSLLLLITLLRLALNVNSTRLILGTGEPGNVIKAFGNAVIGGNYVVGLVIFLILVVINFMVITKGSGRIAEVAARFTLDAMPGRQMSIDADLSAGLIDEAEARRRRAEITRYADFYGAMDGAAKFVRGDAVAGLVITGINLVGGFVIGMLQRGLSASDALSTYTSLTVGDGLVTQIPALIVSTSAGIIVTYGSTSPSVGPALTSQLTRHPRAVWMASGILGMFALMPGFPAIPFLMLSAATGTIAWHAKKKQEEEALHEEAARKPAPSQRSLQEPPPLKDLLQVEQLELEVGYALVPLVDEKQKGDLLQRIGLMRKQVAMELGIIVPSIRIRDNIQLSATEYSIKLRGVRVARGEVMPQYLLALNTGGSVDRIDGVQTSDPSFGMPAVWITPDRRIEAESKGYTVVEPQTVLSTHLMETIKAHAADLLGRQETQEIIDAVKEVNPALVDDVVPNKLSLGVVHRVLQRLLKERIPIRDIVTILEALSDAGEKTKDPEQLNEHVRRALSSVIVQMFEDADGAIRGITVGPRMEAALIGLFAPNGREGAAAVQPEQITMALRSLNDLVMQHSKDGIQRPLIAPPNLRVGVRRLVEPVLPKLPIISLGELPPHTPVISLATWELQNVA